MPRPFYSPWPALGLLLCAATWPALATAQRATASDPTQASATVPPASHRSAFGGYRRLAEVEPLPWREANETVNRIGGWRTYAREAAPPAAPAALAPAGPTALPRPAPTPPAHARPAPAPPAAGPAAAQTTAPPATPARSAQEQRHAH